MKAKLFIVSAVLFLIGSGAGIWRYGSVDALIRRVDAEIRSYRPKPVAAPTLMPIATVDAVAFAATLDKEDDSSEEDPAKEDPANEALIEQAKLPRELLPTFTPIPTLAPLSEIGSNQTEEISEETSIGDQTDPEGRPSPTLTPLPPTSTPLPTLSPTPTPLPLYAPVAENVYLSHFRHHWQEWNNCGPATVATYLSTFDVFVTQEETASFLKPNEKDKNVTVPEIVEYVDRNHGRLEVRDFVNGDTERLKLLLSNNVAVMLATWLEETPNDGMGHYRLLIGYDGETDEWIVSDSFVSEDVEMPYSGIRIQAEEFLRLWSVMERRYIVMHPPEDSELVDAIIGDDIDREMMIDRSISEFQEAIVEDSQNPIVWHTLGELLVDDGRPNEAVIAFDQARTLGLPWRMFWYNFGIFEAYYAAERYQDIIDLANATIESGGAGEELYYWRGMAYMADGDLDRAENSFYNALWWYPEHPLTVAGLQDLREIRRSR